MSSGCCSCECCDFFSPTATLEHGAPWFFCSHACTPVLCVYLPPCRNTNGGLLISTFACTLPAWRSFGLVDASMKGKERSAYLGVQHCALSYDLPAPHPEGVGDVAASFHSFARLSSVPCTCVFFFKPKKTLKVSLIHSFIICCNIEYLQKWIQKESMDLELFTLTSRSDSTQQAAIISLTWRVQVHLI